MTEITYKQAKGMVCKHLRKILSLLEKTNIECNDGWYDWIICPECDCRMNLSDGFEVEDFGEMAVWSYPIDEIKIGKTFHRIEWRDPKEEDRK